MKKIFFILIYFFIFISNTFAENNDNDILDNKLMYFCNNYTSDFEISDYMRERCYLIGQTMYRFEKGGQCNISHNNNCFNFKRISYKNKKDDFGLIGLDKSGFSIFESRTDSIKYFVYHFYTFNRFKTIKQIISGGSYISPVDNKWKTFSGFTATTEDQQAYILFVRNYYLTNKIYEE